MNHQEAVATLASERYLLGEMNDAERDAFEDHYFSCIECAADVRSGARMADGVRAGLAKAEVVPIRRAWRPAIAIPWAAAATLAVVAGYESVHTPSGGFTAGTPVALAPSTLRPATRGEEPAVTPGPGGVVTLAVVVPGGSSGSIRYSLRRDDGTAVASGDAPAPVGGAPLLLMLPAGLLSSGQHYVLAMENPGNAGLTGEEYRFRVDSR